MSSSPRAALTRRAVAMWNWDVVSISCFGKAVANLALRLGLGHLTNKVFSLFIGDEIDASLDVDRAQQTSSAIRGLNQSFLQTVLVTHTYLEEDYCINLGGDGM